MLVLPIPGIDGVAASAGAVPIQTTPTIIALLNNTVRIDLTPLALVHEKPIISRVNRKATRLSNWSDVRFGSLADMCKRVSDVRFTPISGHAQYRRLRLLSTISGHKRTASYSVSP